MKELVITLFYTIHYDVILLYINYIINSCFYNNTVVNWLLSEACFFSFILGVFSISNLIELLDRKRVWERVSCRNHILGKLDQNQLWLASSDLDSCLYAIVTIIGQINTVLCFYGNLRARIRRYTNRFTVIWACTTLWFEDCSCNLDHCFV